MEKKKHTFLIVDDDSFFRMLLRQILRDEDYEVVGEAPNGEEAVRKCADLVPSVVLLDIVMPKLDGIEALERIKVLYPSTIVIMISGDATVDRVREAIGKGAAGFVVKPFNPAKVIENIRNCIGTNSVSAR
jgi:two-component system chemotaxis response regulator CheY